MAKRGPKRVLDRELQYWELMGNGVGTVEACRITGVSRSTGYRWRAEMGGVISRAATTASGRYLSMRERQRIGDLRSQGMSIRAIAARIGRSPSTVSRELSRNIAPGTQPMSPSLLICVLMREPVARNPERSHPAGGSRDSSRPDWMSAGARADQPAPAPAFPRAARPQCVPGNELPGSVSTGGGNPSGFDQEASHRPAIAPAPAPSGSTHHPFRGGDALNPRPPHRGPGPTATRSLGRRPHYRHQESIRNWNHRGAHEPLHLARPPFRQQVRCRRHCRRGQDTSTTARAHAHQPDVGPRNGDGRPRRHRIGSGHAGVLLRSRQPLVFNYRVQLLASTPLLRQYFPKGTDLSVHTPSDLRRIQKELNNRPRKSLSGRTPYEVFTELSATIDPLRCDDR
jgi:transposase